VPPRRYSNHVDSDARKVVVKQELEWFEKRLSGNTAPFHIGTFTLREIFDAFLYGASLMHTVPHEKKASRRDFLEIYDKFPKARVLYALNAGLMGLMNHVGRIAVLIQQDYSHWQAAYSLPLPDVRWHDRLFHVEIDN
jgi:hypothetical protein